MFNFFMWSLVVLVAAAAVATTYTIIKTVWDMAK